VNESEPGVGEVAVDECGEGEALLLLHGLGANRGIWQAVTPELARSRRVIAPDLPGFGDSRPLDGGFALERAADAIAAAGAERIDGAFDLLGHSLGGAVAVSVARRHPGLVRRLVLCAPAGLAPRPDLVAIVLSSGAPAFLSARRTIGRRLAGSRTARRALLFGAVHDGGRLTEDQAVALLDASREAGALRSAARVAISVDVRSEVARIGCPVGLMWGERDLVVAAKSRSELADRYPALPLETIPSAGHVAQVERPREFAAALERLLGRLRVAP
jgi:pimeloyl-ACP methyl ester carboxylesterase